jgi:hypothetical protein
MPLASHGGSATRSSECQREDNTRDSGVNSDTLASGFLGTARKILRALLQLQGKINKYFSNLLLGDTFPPGMTFTWSILMYSNVAARAAARDRKRTACTASTMEPGYIYAWAIAARTHLKSSALLAKCPLKSGRINSIDWLRCVTTYTAVHTSAKMK